MRMSRTGKTATSAVLLISLTLAASGPVLANSWRDVEDRPPLTQTHTLFFNTVTCFQGKLGYAFVNWTTRFQRTVGANREFGQVRYVVESRGRQCDGTGFNAFSTGVRTYYPRFGNSNDITWTGTLQWAATVPDFEASGTSAKGYYRYKSGQPTSWAQIVCNTIDAFGIQEFASCPVL